jgi:DNA-binding MarR family transcriptional regulator
LKQGRDAVARQAVFVHVSSVAPEPPSSRRRPVGTPEATPTRSRGAGAEHGGAGDVMAGERAIRGEAGRNPAAARARDERRAPLKLEQFLPYRLNVVASLVSQALSRVYARRYGIGVPEWRVLVTLGQYGVMTAKAVGAHTHMHKTKVSRAVTLMERRRLLARRANREDMREAFLSLTAAGRAMYEEVAPHALDFARRLTDILTPADREAFDRALEQLTARSAELASEIDGLGEDE